MQQNNYDAIVIGAGSVGLPAAYNLSRAGKKVLLIDQFASMGQGSNKKAIGGIRATHSEKAKIHLGNRSLQIFKNWKVDFGDEIEWHQGGYSFVAYSDKIAKELNDIVTTQRALGLNIDWLDKAQLLSRIPDLNPTGLLGGTLSPEDGSASPLLMAVSLFKHCSRLGTDIRFHEKFLNFIVQTDEIKGIETNQGKYYAPVVINAAGPWAAEVAAQAGINLPVMPDSHEAAITEPVARFFDPMIVDIEPDEVSSSCYFYQHLTGPVFFCVTPAPKVWGMATDETSAFLPHAARRIVKLMPRLKTVRVRRCWRGLYPMTPDGNPLVGWAREVKGLFQLAGMCGQGFMLGPALGELAAHAILGTITAADLEILDSLSPYRQFAHEEKLG